MNANTAQPSLRPSTPPTPDIPQFMDVNSETSDETETESDEVIIPETPESSSDDEYDADDELSSEEVVSKKTADQSLHEK